MKSLLFPLMALGLASAASAQSNAPFTVEETGKAFDLSELVAIGARPEFDPALLNAAWARVAGTGQRQPARHRPSRA